MTRALRLEWFLATVASALLGAWLPLHAGFLGWSWDALNHHVYLGLIAEHPRWDLDVIAASVQSYQYPYLYWPVYRLSQWQGDPLVVAACWSAFQAAMVALPVWLAASRLLPTGGAESIALRTAACVAAFMSPVVLASIETTANDLMAAVPLLWAVAISLRPDFDTRRAALAGALWGVSVAFKLSQGLFLPWALLWCYQPGPARVWLQRAAAIGASSLLAFCLAYLPWGWQLWQVTGNPMHPLFSNWFMAPR